jgi:hypothetical protein
MIVCFGMQSSRVAPIPVSVVKNSNPKWGNSGTNQSRHIQAAAAAQVRSIRNEPTALAPADISIGTVPHCPLAAVIIGTIGSMTAAAARAVCGSIGGGVPTSGTSS